MTENLEGIKAATKAFIMQEFLSGENPDELAFNTPLLSGGILDSISTVKLVGFLEEQYRVDFEAHEISEDHLDTLDSIAALVEQKIAAK